MIAQEPQVIAATTAPPSALHPRGTDGLQVFEKFGSPASFRTKIHATTLSPVSYEPWFESQPAP